MDSVTLTISSYLLAKSEGGMQRPEEETDPIIQHLLLDRIDILSPIKYITVLALLQ